MRYIYDQGALAPDPNLAGLVFDFGSFATLANSSLGQALQSLVRSRAATLALFGAVAAAPSRPPVVAIEHLLSVRLGNDAFADDMKRLSGRLVKQVVEYLGGSWVRSGVPVTVPSQYNKASIYDFPDRPRRRRQSASQ